MKIFTRKNTLIFLLFITALSLGYLYWQSLQEKPIDPLTSVEEIVPGQTQITQLGSISSLYFSDQAGTGSKYLFGENKARSYTEVIASDGIVQTVRKTNPAEFEFQSLQEYTQKYGSPAWEETTSWSDFGYSGYVYIDAGKIIVAHQRSGEVIEEWIISKNLGLDKIKALLNTNGGQQGN